MVWVCRRGLYSLRKHLSLPTEVSQDKALCIGDCSIVNVIKQGKVSTGISEEPRTLETKLESLFFNMLIPLIKHRHQVVAIVWMGYTPGWTHGIGHTEVKAGLASPTELWALARSCPPALGPLPRAPVRLAPSALAVHTLLLPGRLVAWSLLKHHSLLTSWSLRVASTQMMVSFTLVSPAELSVWKPASISLSPGLPDKHVGWHRQGSWVSRLLADSPGQPLPYHPASAEMTSLLSGLLPSPGRHTS